eukprot:GHVU01200420.1.p1 GENE.GHVU01200420.1~~GHVU01200420.1.p1  ORF type:complete len:1246 (-),score=189.43 GHVU01200420.1:1533-5270(-)
MGLVVPGVMLSCFSRLTEGLNSLCWRTLYPDLSSRLFGTRSGGKVVSVLAAASFPQQHHGAASSALATSPRAISEALRRAAEAEGEAEGDYDLQAVGQGHSARGRPFPSSWWKLWHLLDCGDRLELYFARLTPSPLLGLDSSLLPLPSVKILKLKDPPTAFAVDSYSTGRLRPLLGSASADISSSGSMGLQAATAFSASGGCCCTIGALVIATHKGTFETNLFYDLLFGRLQQPPRQPPPPPTAAYGGGHLPWASTGTSALAPTGSALGKAGASGGAGTQPPVIVWSVTHDDGRSGAPSGGVPSLTQYNTDAAMYSSSIASLLHGAAGIPGVAPAADFSSSNELQRNGNYKWAKEMLLRGLLYSSTGGTSRWHIGSAQARDFATITRQRMVQRSAANLVMQCHAALPPPIEPPSPHTHRPTSTAHAATSTATTTATTRLQSEAAATAAGGGTVEGAEQDRRRHLRRHQTQKLSSRTHHHQQQQSTDAASRSNQSQSTSGEPNATEEGGGRRSPPHAVTQRRSDEKTFQRSATAAASFNMSLRSSESGVGVNAAAAPSPPLELPGPAADSYALASVIQWLKAADAAQSRQSRVALRDIKQSLVASSALLSATGTGHHLISAPSTSYHPTTGATTGAVPSDDSYYYGGTKQQFSILKQHPRLPIVAAALSNPASTAAGAVLVMLCVFGDLFALGGLGVHGGGAGSTNTYPPPKLEKSRGDDTRHHHHNHNHNHNNNHHHRVTGFPLSSSPSGATEAVAATEAFYEAAAQQASKQHGSGRRSSLPGGGGRTKTRARTLTTTAATRGAATAADLFGGRAAGGTAASGALGGGGGLTTTTATSTNAPTPSQSLAASASVPYSTLGSVKSLNWNAAGDRLVASHSKGWISVWTVGDSTPPGAAVERRAGPMLTFKAHGSSCRLASFLDSRGCTLVTGGKGIRPRVATTTAAAGWGPAASGRGAGVVVGVDGGGGRHESSAAAAVRGGGDGAANAADSMRSRDASHSWGSSPPPYMFGPPGSSSSVPGASAYGKTVTANPPGGGASMPTTIPVGDVDGCLCVWELFGRYSLGKPSLVVCDAGFKDGSEPSHVCLWARQQRLVYGGKKGEVRILDLRTLQAREVLQAHSKAVVKVFVLEQSHRLVTVCEDSMVRIWDLSGEVPVGQVSPGGVEEPWGGAGGDAAGTGDYALLAELGPLHSASDAIAGRGGFHLGSFAQAFGGAGNKVLVDAQMISAVHLLTLGVDGGVVLTRL